MNPYHFVRFGPPGKREAVTGHGHFKGYSGVIQCRLTAQTHLFTPQTQEDAIRTERRRRGDEHQELKMMRGVGDTPLLPGSSLKGVFRSVAEAISGSCLTLPQSRRGTSIEYRDRPPIRYQIPRGFEHCDNDNYLCPACRLFGWLGSQPFLGKIGFSDALAIQPVETETLTIEALMEPKPRHQIWYEDPQRRNTMRGRKFYYHRPAGPRIATQKNQYNKTVETVRPGTVFEFKVDYANLTNDELALLIFTLTLEPGMYHKVGMGKPVGLGSAKLEITGWEQINRQARYEQLGGGLRRLEGEPLAAEIARQQAHYRQAYAQWQDSLADLRRIWAWDTTRREEVKYPEQKWFRQNPDAPIEKAP